MSLKVIKRLQEGDGQPHSEMGEAVTSLDGSQGHQDPRKSSGCGQVRVTFPASAPEGACTGSYSRVQTCRIFSYLFFRILCIFSSFLCCWTLKERIYAVCLLSCIKWIDRVHFSFGLVHLVMYCYETKPVYRITSNLGEKEILMNVFHVFRG